MYLIQNMRVLKKNVFYTLYTRNKKMFSINIIKNNRLITIRSSRFILLKNKSNS